MVTLLAQFAFKFNGKINLLQTLSANDVLRVLQRNLQNANCKDYRMRKMNLQIVTQKPCINLSIYRQNLRTRLATSGDLKIAPYADAIYGHFQALSRSVI